MGKAIVERTGGAPGCRHTLVDVCQIGAERATTQRTDTADAVAGETRGTAVRKGLFAGEEALAGCRVTRWPSRLSGGGGRCCALQVGDDRTDICSAQPERGAS